MYQSGKVLPFDGLELPFDGPGRTLCHIIGQHNLKRWFGVCGPNGSLGEVGHLLDQDVVTSVPNS